jgi:hypothetical protein
VETIVLTPNELPAANPARLLEELEAALGFGVTLEVRQQGGMLIEALVSHIGGEVFTTGEVTTVLNVAALHDPEMLSSGQAAEEMRVSRRDAARDRLRVLNTDDVRLMDLSALANVVADLVEALGLSQSL